MEKLFYESDIRKELQKLDKKTGLHGADLPIKFGKAKSMLGYFSYDKNSYFGFYFSNHYFLDPDLPVEEKLNVIRHEYAHYLDYMQRGFSAHDAEWKKCCNIVGSFPIRCFNKDRADSYLAKHQKEEELNSKLNKYSIGTEIKHPVFGLGTIKEIFGSNLTRSATVEFHSVGEKRLSLNWIEANCFSKHTP